MMDDERVYWDDTYRLRVASTYYSFGLPLPKKEKPPVFCVAGKIWMLRGLCPRCKSLSVNSARDVNEDELFRYCAFCRYDGPIDIIFEYIIQKTDWKECDEFGNVS